METQEKKESRRLGGMQAAAVNKLKYGDDFYSVIGRKGGSAKVKKGFAVRRDLAAKFGKKGGQVTKDQYRNKLKNV